jgi:hypothetical protein
MLKIKVTFVGIPEAKLIVKQPQAVPLVMAESAKFAPE